MWRSSIKIFPFILNVLRCLEQSKKQFFGAYRGSADNIFIYKGSQTYLIRSSESKRLRNTEIDVEEIHLPHLLGGEQTHDSFMLH